MISEAITNAAKHSGAEQLEIVLRHQAANHQEGDGPATVLVTVTDDGRGGADPTGRGLTGLAGRVAANDGTFSVHSPAGGPTIVKAELPCA